MEICLYWIRPLVYSDQYCQHCLSSIAGREPFPVLPGNAMNWTWGFCMQHRCSTMGLCPFSAQHRNTISRIITSIEWPNILSRNDIYFLGGLDADNMQIYNLFLHSGKIGIPPPRLVQMAEMPVKAPSLFSEVIFWHGEWHRSISETGPVWRFSCSYL